MQGDTRATGRSDEVLEVPVVPVILRELKKVTLHRRHEREAAVRDVPEDSSVTSRPPSERKSWESFVVNVGHNATPYVVRQEYSGALIGLLGGLSDRGVDQRLRRGVRPLQRKRGGSPMEAADSGLLCVKRVADGLEVLMVGILIKKSTKEEEGDKWRTRMVDIDRKPIFPTAKLRF